MLAAAVLVCVLLRGAGAACGDMAPSAVATDADLAELPLGIDRVGPDAGMPGSWWPALTSVIDKSEENGGKAFVNKVTVSCIAAFSVEQFHGLLERASREGAARAREHWLGGWEHVEDPIYEPPKIAENERHNDPRTQPFVAKLRLPPGTRVAIFGDTHGSLAAVMAELYALHRDGLLSAAGDVAPGAQIIFCGDLLDRGKEPLEVLALALALRERNARTGRVVVVRGNHSRQSTLGHGRARRVRAICVCQGLPGRAVRRSACAAGLAQRREWPHDRDVLQSLFWRARPPQRVSSVRSRLA
jgi:hypothetical protein